MTDESLKVPDFVAIDFETANRSPRSAVAMALSRVIGGVPSARVVTLLRPPTRMFSFTHLHGIGAAQVAKAPEFGTAWPDAQRLFTGARFIAAHNAAFDMQVLNACCEHAKVATPRVPWLCTVMLAREVWSTFPTTLPNVCGFLGIPLRHHDAASDAEACATIVCAAWRTAVGRKWLERFRR